MNQHKHTFDLEAQQIEQANPNYNEQNRRKHPKALPFLFLTEMWERFGYYLIIAIFTLYLTALPESKGMGFDRKTASDIYGTFIALVYLTPFLGGLLADRLLGYRLSIIIGGILMGTGYILLSVRDITVFYLALAIIILGNGFFKPNISTLLGNLYSEPQFKDKKDAGYNIFYMGINIGAFLCPFVAAYMRLKYGWGHAFIAAGVGMFLGIIIFMLGLKHYKSADVRKPPRPDDTKNWIILGIVLLVSLILGLFGFYFRKITGLAFLGDSTNAFVFAALPVILFYINVWLTADEHEKSPLAALLAIFGVVIIFWAVFKQNGTALTTWSEFYTDRSMPAGLSKYAKEIGLTQEITAKKDSVPKYDAQFRPERQNGKIVKVFGQHPYLNNLPSEKHPKENETLLLVPTELFQAVNPFWVIVLTPVIVSFFAWLRKRNKEPKTPTKIMYGLLISALSTLCMVAAVKVCDNGATKAGMSWLILTYFVITIGELCLSPMGLSLVSKLSPARVTGLMMGGWSLATSLGNKLSGVLATLWDNYDNKANFFLLNTILLLFATGLILVLLRWLNRVFTQYVG
ncbi:MAG: peptide MFS transporter [Bacteroidia bacterium]|nr:peptide MFS transporter [Bacteroidia bacterium]